MISYPIVQSHICPPLAFMLVDQNGGLINRAIIFNLFDPLREDKAFGVLDFKVIVVKVAVNVNIYNITLKRQPS